MCIVAAANERSITIAQSAAQTRGTEAKEDLIVESVVINVQRHPCAISIGASLPLSLSLSLSLLLFHPVLPLSHFLFIQPPRRLSRFP